MSVGSSPAAQLPTRSTLLPSSGLHWSLPLLTRLWHECQSLLLVPRVVRARIALLRRIGVLVRGGLGSGGESAVVA